MSIDYHRIKDFKAIYEKEGAYHHHARGFRSWFLRDNYTAIARECRKDDTVLDLACGEGCLGPYLDVKWLVGVDYSEEALRLNRELHPNVYDELRLGDLRSLAKMDLPRSFFNVVVCSLSLMYLVEEDLKRCVREVHDFLLRGGYFVCTYPTVGPYRKGCLEAAELPPEDLIERLLEVGFKFEKAVPICPLVPKNVVETSEAAETEEIAYREYLVAKKRMTLETSYHFLCKVRKD